MLVSSIAAITVGAASSTGNLAQLPLTGSASLLLALALPASMVVAAIGLLRTRGFNRGRFERLSGLERALYRVAILWPFFVAGAAFAVILIALFLAVNGLGAWAARERRIEETAEGVRRGIDRS